MSAYFRLATIAILVANSQQAFGQTVDETLRGEWHSAYEENSLPRNAFLSVVALEPAKQGAKLVLTEPAPCSSSYEFGGVAQGWHVFYSPGTWCFNSDIVKIRKTQSGALQVEFSRKQGGAQKTLMFQPKSK